MKYFSCWLCAFFLDLFGSQSLRVFTSKPIFSTPDFSFLLSLKCVKLLNRFHHFKNNSWPPPENNKFHKIKPILNYIGMNFSDVYTSVREIYVESLFLWKGRLFSTMYKSKAKSGYIRKLVVYVRNKTYTKSTV